MNGALQVWSGNVSAGLLARTVTSGAVASHTFAYHTTQLAGEAQVSLTMPIRLESWNSQDLHPNAVIWQDGKPVITGDDVPENAERAE